MSAVYTVWRLAEQIFESHTCLKYFSEFTSCHSNHALAICTHMELMRGIVHIGMVHP